MMPSDKFGLEGLHEPATAGGQPVAAMTVQDLYYILRPVLYRLHYSQADLYRIHIPCASILSI